MTSCLLVGIGGGQAQDPESHDEDCQGWRGCGDSPSAMGQGQAAITSLVTQLVELSFGPRFRTQVRRLVQTYVEWQADGYFR